ncbi:molybdopterin molybdenumtransferase MoeA [Planotetraspora thailandica]|uniref:Molybdopterin molybdenumtransferase n=1 Tax=Planotetraspora thailandica TaxID=487172 RepID=A0A8J4DCZ7_9ACTN|nr:molybdopterin molybdotransferase MoeA [Planotetraspora thailandica]GII58258.1 molybdopterin molybdenumtransferase MoeA [Planotetraspora thailandica]
MTVADRIRYAETTASAATPPRRDGHGDRHRGLHGAPVPWDTARRIATQAVRPLPPADLPLSLAGGCRLAQPLRALVALPRDDVAAMDGYAVAGPSPWRVVGRVLAGQPRHRGTLAPGTAVEIATGAPVPEGADSVLPYEAASERRGLAATEVSGDSPYGRHIRRRGEECAEGSVVLGAGAPLTPVALGLAAGLGHDTLRVHPLPVVGVLITGDEVVGAGLPGEGRVRDAVGPLLPGLIEWAGGRAGESRWVPDGEAALTRAIAAHCGSADVIAVCGASSKGRADHLRPVLSRLGADVLVDGVAVRPGHPQLLARLPGGRLVVGLPGNPYAALAAALTLLLPAVRGLLGRPECRGERTALAETVPSHPSDTRLVAVRRSARGAVPVGHDRPGSLWGAALADALAVVPPRWEGGPVELLALPA